jgi:beta-hydroxyacyl-ACP dehydratase FabZ
MVFGIAEIMEMLPHRYPFLLVDGITELDKEKKIVGIKNVTINEPFFQGHFPGHPVMPGVLIIEAMAQVGAVLMLCDIADRDKKLVYFTGIDGARFRQPVVPGDVLTMTLTVTRLRSRVCRMHGDATVNGVPVAEADIKSAIVDR